MNSVKQHFIHDEEATLRASVALRGELLIALPTDTVFGIMGDARSDIAIAQLYKAKRRAETKKLALLLPSLRVASHYAEFNDAARALAEHHWPGSLTLVLPVKKGVTLHPAVAEATVAVRVSAHPYIQAIYQQIDFPLFGTSANLSGQPEVKDDVEASNCFGEDIAVILQGKAGEGKASTVVDMTAETPQVLRQGSVFIT